MLFEQNQKSIEQSEIFNKYNISFMCRYLCLYHIKRHIAKAILECVDLWNSQQHHSSFKIGIEVKAVFTKNHPNVQNPEVDPIIEHRIMFIHQILQKVVVGHLAQVDLEALGSLISSIEWQCLDENHNRDSAHILHNIFEFRIHIYSVNTMQAGGGLIPSKEDSGCKGSDQYTQ